MDAYRHAGPHGDACAGDRRPLHERAYLRRYAWTRADDAVTGQPGRGSGATTPVDDAPSWVDQDFEERVFE
jgi:hypothetical protein